MFEPRTPPILEPPIRLAVCISGGGTTLLNLVEAIRTGALDASIEITVSSRVGVAGIGRSEAAGIPTRVIARRELTLADFSKQVFEAVREARADLVVLGGFLSLIEIPPDYEGRVINIHPSLLPAFGGKGFHGEAVHRAAIETGVKVSGCTVHFADATYDTGPIILQKTVPVLDNDTAATLAARVFAAECKALPEAIALFAEGRLRREGRRVRVLDPVRE